MLTESANSGHGGAMPDEHSSMNTTSQNENFRRGSTSAEPRRPVALFCIHAETPLSKEQFFALQQAVIDVAEKFSVEHAVFAGNNLISNIEAVWGKDVL